MNHWRSVDAHITHSLTVILSSIIVVQMYICIIDNQYILSVYYYLHPDALSPLTIGFTSTCVIWAINDVALLCCSAFGQQFAVCKSNNPFSINIAWLSHLSWSSSFFSISMSYHKKFLKSWPCGPGLSRDLCNWMHGGMQHDGYHAYRFVICSHRSFYDSYYITYLKVVCKFLHRFRFCFRT